MIKSMLIKAKPFDRAQFSLKGYPLLYNIKYAENSIYVTLISFFIFIFIYSHCFYSHVGHFQPFHFHLSSHPTKNINGWFSFSFRNFTECTYNQLISYIYLSVLQLILMFQENSSNHSPNSHNSGSNETHEGKKSSSNKTKAIRKSRSREDSNQHSLSETLMKNQLTKEQKKEIQKQKNRVAAQLSRDRQKKYVQDLEGKIVELQKQLNSRLCIRCKATLSEHSTTEEQIDEHQSLMPPVSEPQHNDISLLNDVPEIQEIGFVRDNSRNDLQWGNIGKYFCVFMIVFGIALLSNSVQGVDSGVSQHQVARILTEGQICNKPINNVNRRINSTIPSTIELIQSQSLPFHQNDQPTQKCKASFWNNYLDSVREQVHNPLDWNLVNCNNPQLVHISSIYQNQLDRPEDKWTFLITNPTVTHSHIENNGKYYVDEVSYLTGVYQMIAEKVVLKKVMGKNCLA